LHADAHTLLTGRIAAVLNVGSGRCDPDSAARVKAIFEAAGLSDFEIAAVEPGDVEAALDRAAAQAAAVVVLGGDGTIRTAAIKCGAAGIPPAPAGATPAPRRRAS